MRAVRARGAVWQSLWMGDFHNPTCRRTSVRWNSACSGRLGSAWLGVRGGWCGGFLGSPSHGSVRLGVQYAMQRYWRNCFDAGGNYGARVFRIPVAERRAVLWRSWLVSAGRCASRPALCSGGRVSRPCACALGCLPVPGNVFCVLPCCHHDDVAALAALVLVLVALLEMSVGAVRPVRHTVASWVPSPPPTRCLSSRVLLRVLPS